MNRKMNNAMADSRGESTPTPPRLRSMSSLVTHKTEIWKNRADEVRGNGHAVDVETIRPRELKEKLAAPEPLVLLDVREEDERARCVIGSPGGVVDLHIPMSQVPSRIAELAGERGPIVVYCHHGVRSMVVARWLARRGVAGLLNLDGGIDAWSREVDASVPRY